MNKVIKFVTSIMIVVLIMTLIGIFLSYYKNNENINTIVYPSGDLVVSHPNTSGDYFSSGSKDHQGLIESIIQKSGDNQKNDNHENNNQEPSNQEPNDQEPNGQEPNNSKTENPGNVNDKTQTSEDNMPSTVIEIPNEEDNEVDGQLLISSDPETSNQQKQEILTEIDTALQGLLEAVSKVETVDENRLNATLNSEVVKP